MAKKRPFYGPVRPGVDEPYFRRTGISRPLSPKPPKTEIIQAPPKPEVKPPEVFRDPETGRLSGITIGGKTYLGLGPEDVERIAAGERKRVAVPEGAIEVGEARRLEDIEREKERLLDEEVPERRELDPFRTGPEKLPAIGQWITASRGIGKWLNKKLGRSFDIDLTPEEMRTAALTAIEKEEIEKGLTINEALGAYVEALPLSGFLGIDFSKNLEMPSANAREVMSNIRKIKRQITNIETNVKMGYLPVSVAQSQVRDMELNIQGLESRLKMLINNSPSLKFNSDEVNTMETEILIVREKLFQSKLNVLEGKAKDPDEMDLLLKMEEMGLILGEEGEE